MLRRIHQKLGSAGFAIAIVALIAALGGTALAASGALTGKQKKEVEKIAKKFQGTGPTGAPGANGTNGTNGKDGAPGAKGDKGDPGVPGESVQLASATGCGEPGGTKLSVGAEEAEVCNGQTGFTETLPAGKTLMGDWSLNLSVHGLNERTSTDVSFGIPLETAPAVHVIKENNKEEYFDEVAEEFKERVQPECPGIAEAPEAKPGNLCVYTSHEEGGQPAYAIFPLPKICASGSTYTVEGEEFAEVGIGCLSGPPQADRSGFTLMTISNNASGFVELGGTWAVTAAE